MNAMAPPTMKELKRLATQIRTFPITGRGIVDTAKRLGYDEEFVDFLRGIHEETKIENQAELLEYAEAIQTLRDFNSE